MSENPIAIPTVVTVKELSDLLDRSVNEVITILIRFGVMANINQDIDFDTASIVADELGIAITEKNTQSAAAAPSANKAKTETHSVPRPAVVTIMGHVDHGKTTLLDTLRHTNVAAGEAGGITQAISSYQVEVVDPEKEGDKRIITFVDTPGHSAFEAMRKHGVSITDLVVLVVAANEGVKPQTVEAIKHVTSMKAPMVVAITKTDLPNADIERAKRELSEVNVIPEEWGGTVPMVPISATKGENIDKLLEVIMLATDLLELKSDPDAPAAGVVIESHMESGLGPVATVLIQDGTLRVGQAVVIGGSHGKVRAIEDHRGRRIKQATAAMPVRISGISEVPSFGERLIVAADEREGRDIARQNGTVSQREVIAKRAAELTKMSKRVEGRVELSLVIKADTQGSLNAILDLVNNLSNDDVMVHVIKADVGPVAEQDVARASAAHGPIIAFNAKPATAVAKLARDQNVSVHNFKIIYELEQLIVQTVSDLMPEVEVEREVGSLEVLRRFRDNRKHVVVGGTVHNGILKTGQLVVISRGSEELGRASIVDLRTGKEQVTTVKAGNECGVELAIDGRTLDVAPRDLLKAVVIERVKKTATAAAK